MSLLWKILLPILALIFVLSSVSGYVSYRQTEEALKMAVIDNMRGEVLSLKRMLTYILEESELILNRTTEYDKIQIFMSEYYAGAIGESQQNEMDAWLLKTAASQALIERFNIFDTEGTIIASSLPSAVGGNFKQREYFTEALVGKTFISKPFQSAISNGA